MPIFGFSTGALALGDFRRALALLRDVACEAIELSALRARELRPLLEAVDDLDLAKYRYISVHAPSRFDTMREAEAADLLARFAARGWRVVVHPDAIADAACWRPFGPLLCIENMDKRKPTGRTALELAPFFDALPDASLCLDLGHARQVDPTMTHAHGILSAYGGRLVEVHLSELNAASHHEPLSLATVLAVQELADRIDPECAVILESRVAEDSILRELRMAERAFTIEAAPRSASAAQVELRPHAG